MLTSAVSLVSHISMELSVLLSVLSHLPECLLSVRSHLPEPVLFGQWVVSMHQCGKFGVPHLHGVARVSVRSHLPEPVLFGQWVVSMHQCGEFGVPHLHGVACVDDTDGCTVLPSQTHAELLDQRLHFL